MQEPAPCSNVCSPVIGSFETRRALSAHCGKRSWFLSQEAVAAATSRLTVSCLRSHRARRRQIHVDDADTNDGAIVAEALDVTSHRSCTHRRERARLRDAGCDRLGFSSNLYVSGALVYWVNPSHGVSIQVGASGALLGRTAPRTVERPARNGLQSASVASAGFFRFRSADASSRLRVCSAFWAGESPVRVAFSRSRCSRLSRRRSFAACFSAEHVFPSWSES